MFYLDSNDKEMCCGCQACKMICPTNCISMHEDERGFVYPKKDKELCIDCGMCEEVCPFIQKSRIDYDNNMEFPKAYLAINKDEDILFNSASGGVFSAVTNTFCDDNFVVFGVQFDQSFNAIHTHTDSIEGTYKYRKSKYLQSDISSSYKEAEEFLKKGKKVLFTGTPCQIAGLRLYLGKDYENLLCLDLVCHGVPAQAIFNKYLNYLEFEHGGKVTGFTFRHKTVDEKGIRNSRNVKMDIGSKEIIMNSKNDKYLRGFHNALFYRPSCYNCKYANPNRISDITMADFWGVDKLFPEEDVHKGVSVILVNTKKGQNIVKQLDSDMYLKETDLQYVVNRNTQLNRPTTKHKRYDDFFRIFDSMRFDEAVDHCIPEPSLIKKIASKILPLEVKRLIKSIINN